MTTRPIVFLLAALGPLAGTCARAAGELVVDADVPVVTVQTRQAGRKFLKLPSLDYQLQISAVCSPGASPERLSLSVADTRMSLSAGDIAAASPLPVELHVPADQIGPVAVAGFCPAEPAHPAAAVSSMLIPSVVSLQASLLCTGESGSQMTYTSRALDVTLECQPKRDTETAPQEPISDAAPQSPNATPSMAASAPDVSNYGASER